MDLQLPDMPGAAAIERIVSIDGAARIIVLTMYSGDEDIFRAIKAGAASYLLKDELSNDLVSVVRQVHQGNSSLPDVIAERLARRVGVSPRELAILELIAAGNRNKEIAYQLGITQDTVQTHIKRLFVKLNVTDRTAAVTVAIARGILHVK
jgi:DNA-binding NarL/FixJ family response regulator